MTQNIVTTDSRIRVSLSKYLESDQLYRVDSSPNGAVTLTPVTAYTRSELVAEIGQEAADRVFDADKKSN